MTYHNIRLKRADFDGLAQEEKTLFLLCWHIIHQISVVEKAVLASSRRFKVVHGNEQTAEVCQFVFFIKHMAGILYEAWQAIGKAYHATTLGKTYHAQLRPETRKALDRLGKYFGRQNTLGAIRNNYSFHSDLNRIASGVALMPPDEDFQMIIPEPGGMLFCGVAEHMINAAMLKEIHAEDYGRAVDQFTKEILIDVSGWIMQFCQDLTSTIAMKFSTETSEERIEHDCEVADLRFPYFVRFQRMK